MPLKPLLTLLVTLLGLTACTPVVVGAGAAVAVDAIIEEEEGGDGLF